MNNEEALWSIIEHEFHNFESICSICKHYIKCEYKQCSDYVEGDTMTIVSTQEEIKQHWDCRDFNFGECDRLVDTPCCGCNYEIGSNWEWNGKPYPKEEGEK